MDTTVSLEMEIPISEQAFLTYETEFGLFLAVLENFILSMGWDESHATLKVTSEF